MMDAGSGRRVIAARCRFEALAIQTLQVVIEINFPEPLEIVDVVVPIAALGYTPETAETHDQLLRH